VVEGPIYTVVSKCLDRNALPEEYEFVITIEEILRHGVLITVYAGDNVLSEACGLAEIRRPK